MSKTKTVDFSIIVTAHNEGLIAHKTMRSIFISLELVKHKTCEIIVHIDNGDKETIAYFERYQNNPKIKVFHNQFGDLGLSRNFAAKKSSGHFIFFIDADDIISSNWLKVALKTLEKNNRYLVHPETSLSFGSDEGNVLWHQKEFSSKIEATKSLFSQNQWTSNIAGPRDVFLHHQYIQNKDGFGQEDYYFNIETTKNGLIHTVAPGTTLFYRKKQESLLIQNNQNKLTQPFSGLFDYKEIKKQCINDNILSQETSLKIKSKIKKNIKKFYLSLRNNKISNIFITPVAEIVKKITPYRVSSGGRVVPDFLIKNWAEANNIERQLYPHNNDLVNIKFYDSSIILSDFIAYEKLSSRIIDYPKYIFIVPWVQTGGGDKVLINYCRAFQKLYPDEKIAVITTLKSRNEWKGKLPDNTFLIDFGNEASSLTEYEKENLFSRLIIQLKCKNLHIINSEYGYLWIKKHLDLISKNFNLNVSIFCHDIFNNQYGIGIFDYSDPYLIDIYAAVKNIFTDNNAVISRILLQTGIKDDSKFKVHYQPIDMIDSSIPKKEYSSGQMNILWASRISSQKQPEVLLEIAKSLDPKQFKIDVYGKIDGSYKKTIFKGIQVLEYKGEFSNINQIDLPKYDTFLYTSAIDGIPNIILEIASKGIPIISSSAGGISEFIVDGVAGSLVEDFSNPKAYIKKILNFRENPQKAQVMAIKAQQLLKKNHSFDNFIRLVEKEIKLK